MALQKIPGEHIRVAYNQWLGDTRIALEGDGQKAEPRAIDRVREFLDRIGFE